MSLGEPFPPPLNVGDQGGVTVVVVAAETRHWAILSAPGQGAGLDAHSRGISWPPGWSVGPEGAPRPRAHWSGHNRGGPPRIARGLEPALAVCGLARLAGVIRGAFTPRRARALSTRASGRSCRASARRRSAGVVNGAIYDQLRPLASICSPVVRLVRLAIIRTSVSRCEAIATPASSRPRLGPGRYRGEGLNARGGGFESLH